MPCKKAVTILLSNIYIEVHLDGQISQKYGLNNSLPQVSELAALLFNIYTSDLPGNAARKFIYIDDIVLMKKFEDFNTEKALENDLKEIDTFFEIWRKPSISKTEVTCFHLNNRQVNYIPGVSNWQPYVLHAGHAHLTSMQGKCGMSQRRNMTL